MSRLRREPTSLLRELAIRFLALAAIVDLFYLFLAFEVYRGLAEWFVQFYQPG